MPKGQEGGFCWLGCDPSWWGLPHPSHNQENQGLLAIGVERWVVHTITLHDLFGLDYSCFCEAIKRIPLSCISSVDMASSAITRVEVDQEGKVYKACLSLKTYHFNIYAECVCE